MEQYENVKEEQVLIEEKSIDDNIDSTFNKLVQMQDEIITKKIAQLEMCLNEIEDVVNTIIESSTSSNC